MTPHSRFLACILGPFTAIFAVLALAGPVAAAPETTAVPPTTINTAPTSGLEVTSSSAPGAARMATETNVITDEGSKQNEGGLYVFLGVCAVILVGAGSLFLKYRRQPARQ